MNWIHVGSGEPQPGERVLITFLANPDRIRVCYFDTKETWEARNNDDLDFEIAEDCIDGWFTEADDPTDWWEKKWVVYWASVSPLPTGTSGENDG